MKRPLLFQVVSVKRPVFEASTNIEEDQEKMKEQKEMDKQFKDIKNITIQILDYQRYSAIIKDLVSKINTKINDIVNGLTPEEHKLYHELAMLNRKTLKPNEKWSKQDITVRFMVAVDVASLFLLRNYQYQQLSHCAGTQIISNRTILMIYKVPFLKPHRFRKLLRENIAHMAFKHKEQIGNLVDQVFNTQMRMRLQERIDETSIEKKELTRLQDIKIAPGIQDQSKILFTFSEVLTAAAKNRLLSSKRYNTSSKNAIKNEMLTFKKENYFLVKEKLLELAIKSKLKLGVIAQFFQEIKNYPQQILHDVDNQASSYKIQNLKWLLFTPKKFSIYQSFNNVIMQQCVSSKRLYLIKAALCSQLAERLVQIIKVNKCLRKILHFQPCETIYIQKYQISYKDYKSQSVNSECIFTIIVGVVDFKIVYTKLIPKKISTTVYTDLVIKQFENSWLKKNYEVVLFYLKANRYKFFSSFQSKRNGFLRFTAEPWYYAVHVALLTMVKLSLKEDSPLITLQNFEQTVTRNIALACKALNATDLKTPLSKIRNISQ